MVVVVRVVMIMAVAASVTLLSIDLLCVLALLGQLVRLVLCINPVLGDG
jgi:hypothetical protein